MSCSAIDKLKELVMVPTVPTVVDCRLCVPLRLTNLIFCPLAPPPSQQPVTNQLDLKNIKRKFNPNNRHLPSLLSLKASSPFMYPPSPNASTYSPWHRLLLPSGVIFVSSSNLQYAQAPNLVSCVQNQVGRLCRGSEHAGK